MAYTFVECPPATPHPDPYTGAAPGERHGFFLHTSTPPVTSGSIVLCALGRVCVVTSTLLLNQKQLPSPQSAPWWIFPPWRELGGHVRCPCAPASRICPSRSETSRRCLRISCVSRGREKWIISRRPRQKANVKSCGPTTSPTCVHTSPRIDTATEGRTMRLTLIIALVALICAPTPIAAINPSPSSSPAPSPSGASPRHLIRFANARTFSYPRWTHLTSSLSLTRRS